MQRRASSGLMERLDRQQVIISLLLILAAVYLLLVFLPGISSTQIIGFSGDMRAGQFVVSRVLNDSPADRAGLQPGDIITKQGDQTTAEWRRLYQSSVKSYLLGRQRLRDQDVAYEVTRNQIPIGLSLAPRALTARETAAHYGIRVLLILFLACLTIFIVASRTKERSAFLICLCFCFAILWQASDEFHWPVLYAPLIRGLSFPGIYFMELIETISLQLVMGTLVHIALVFPERQPILQRYPWLPAAGYLVPLVIPAMVMLFAAGGILDRVTAVYATRIWLNTALLILATLLMLFSYRQCQSAVQRERSRWIIVSLAIVAVSHIALWNVPLLTLGQPLIPSYNWLLIPIALIPLSMTLSITNHELFGIRGIIRGRIKLLETRLGRERAMVTGRDQRIRTLTQEIDQLQSELKEYTQAERPGAGGPVARSSTLKKLENKYPELTRIRQEQLIGASSLWAEVFEQAAVAARGTAPVMIVGESGTGKTHIARAVHALSDRSSGICKEISCAQFEHADPAFALGKLFGVGTGHGLPNVPKDGQSGLLEESDGGTLFLDDFDRLPLNVQDLLLYPLEGKPFEPGIGRGQPRAVSVKFMFATNRDPAELVSAGKFQGDVLARIGTRVDIPPLRKRPEDIPLLVEHFTNKIGIQLKHDVSVISPKAMHLLSRYAYARGNARELMSEIHQAIGKAMLEDDNVLRAGYLSEKLRDARTPRYETAPPVPEESAAPSIAEHKTCAGGAPTELATLRRHRFQIKPAEEELGFSHKSRTLSNHLRGMCIKALSENDWDLARAARWLSESDDPKTVTRIQGKMRRYLKNIEDNVGNHCETKLYNNLPAAYHEPLAKAIRWARTQRQTISNK